MLSLRYKVAKYLYDKGYSSHDSIKSFFEIDHCLQNKSNELSNIISCIYNIKIPKEILKIVTEFEDNEIDCEHLKLINILFFQLQESQWNS